MNWRAQVTYRTGDVIRTVQFLDMSEALDFATTVHNNRDGDVIAIVTL